MSVQPVPRAAATAAASAPRVEGWGRLGYQEALELQLDLWRRRCERRIGDTLACVEHPPTITLGRHAPAADVLAGRAELESRAVAVVRTDRGGRATYHGPGQAVVYPIVGIADLGLGIKEWVALLEDALIEAIAGYEIVGARREGRPGIWASGAKIASVGLRVSRGVSYHGVSLNVAADVSGFDCIITCGASEERVTSIARLATARPSVEEAAGRVCRAIVTRLPATAREAR